VCAVKNIMVAKGRSMKTTKKFNLDEIILKIVREMQPISSKEIWWKTGEMLDGVSMPTQEEVYQRLEEMEQGKILEKFRINSGEKEKYTLVENSCVQ
jgi:DNA-binding Lrp family transcriptional regulator